MSGPLSAADPLADSPPANQRPLWHHVKCACCFCWQWRQWRRPWLTCRVDGDQERGTSHSSFFRCPAGAGEPTTDESLSLLCALHVLLSKKVGTRDKDRRDFFVWAIFVPFFPWSRFPACFYYAVFPSVVRRGGTRPTGRCLFCARCIYC